MLENLTRCNARQFDWEKAEDEADKEIAAGKTKSFDTVEDLISDLKGRESVGLMRLKRDFPRSGSGFDRITFDPDVMGGQACIRGMRITVSLIVNLIANGMSIEDILESYPYLEPDDIHQALKYAT